MLQFLKTTVLGGILFLFPIIIFITIIGKALHVTSKIADPIAGLLGVNAIAGVAVSQLLAIGILVLICFIAGLAAKRPRAKSLVQSLEVNVLKKIPAYEFLKVRTQSVLSPQDVEAMRTVLARFDDSWQLAFEIERIESGHTVIFLPGAPDPWSGSVCIVTKDRVTPLDTTIHSAVKLLKRMGRGSASTLQNAAIVNETIG